jgi:hypothetical protein
VTNPDVTPVGFAATEHPHAPLVRKRGVWWLLVGGVLIAGGIAGVVLFVVQLVGSSSDFVDDAVASGRIAGMSAPATPGATFTVEVAMRYTVWVDTGGIISSGTRDTVVAAANCEATFSDGTTASFRGLRHDRHLRGAERHGRRRLPIRELRWPSRTRRTRAAAPVLRHPRATGQ